MAIAQALLAASRLFEFPTRLDAVRQPWNAPDWSHNLIKVFFTCILWQN